MPDRKRFNRCCALLATVLSLLSTQPLTAGEPRPYWDIRQFKQLTALTPELQHPRLLRIPNDSTRTLWENGQMRIYEGPWDTLRGDFTGDGREDIAVMLVVGGTDQVGTGAAQYLLIATLNDQGSRRRLLERFDEVLRRLDEDEADALHEQHRLYDGQRKRHTTAGLIFDAKRRIVGVVTSETERLTKAASMSTPGYVLEKRLIVPFRWHGEAFHREHICWFLDPNAEDTLKANGVDPEAERMLRRP